MTRFLYSEGTSSILQIRYLGCSRLPNTVNIGKMRRDSYIIHYVTKGRGTFNGTPVKTGQGFLIRPGMAAEYLADPSDPWELYWVVSEDAHMERVLDTFSADPETGVFSYDYAETVRRAADDMLLLPVKSVSASELLRMFLTVFSCQESGNNREQRRSDASVYVEIARETIRSDLREGIRVGDLTRLLGISQPYLYRIFKQETGVSPKEYLSRARLREAKRLLSGTDLSITQIAQAVGYGDVLTFSRFFSAKEGISPSEARKCSRG